MLNKSSYTFLIAIDQDARLSRNDAVEFVNAIIQGLEVLPGGNVSKQFEPQFRRLLQENDYVVVIDKIKIAQKKADEVKDIMRDNVQQLGDNVKLLDEEVVPSALDIARTAYQVQE